VYYTVIKHSGHLRTLEKCRKHSPAARVFYISLEFSNALRVLSQCNTRLRLLYLLNKASFRSCTSLHHKRLFKTKVTLTSHIFSWHIIIKKTTTTEKRSDQSKENSLVRTMSSAKSDLKKNKIFWCFVQTLAGYMYMYSIINTCTALIGPPGRRRS